jgi:hypothetical protein
MPALQTISDSTLVAAIEAAANRVVLIAPGIWPPVANAIGKAWKRLAARYGGGFSETTLQYFRKFYQTYADRCPQIPRPMGVESALLDAATPISRPRGVESLPTPPASAAPAIGHPAGDELKVADPLAAIQHPAGSKSLTGFSPQLSWSHYRALMRVEKPAAREFYEREAIAGSWDKRTLERQITAEASMVFMGNTKKSVAYMLKHSHFFEQLPDKYIDSAFLDRLHAFSPGWEVAPIRNELFTNGYGFIVDYFAEILKHQRSEDFTSAYKQDFEIVSEISTRDQIGVEKTFSGLMKLLFPHGGATLDEIEELLAFAMECRRRVREHILRIDDTFKPNDFIYRRKAAERSRTVLTPEELQYPAFCGHYRPPADGTKPASPPPQSPVAETASLPLDAGAAAATVEDAKLAALTAPEPRHLVIPENSKGWSYRRIFGDYLVGAHKIVVRDPYVRAFHQTRNLMEFLHLVHDLVPDGDEIEVQLITQSDMDTCVKQEENLKQIQQAYTGSRVAFTWELDHNPNFHARSITTDHGWKITIDRGLDLFQRFESGPFSLEQAMQEARLTKGAEVNYIRTEVQPT